MTVLTSMERSGHVARSWKESIPGRPFWIFFLASLVFVLGISMYFFLYSVFLVNLGYTEAQIGRIAAALTAGTLVGAVPAGMIASSVGIRGLLLVSIPCTALTCAIRISLNGYGKQVAFAWLSGLALCTWGVCLAPSVAAVTVKATRSFGFSAIFASGIAMAGAGNWAAARLPGMLQALFRARHIALLDARQSLALMACFLAALAVCPIATLSLGRSPGRLRSDTNGSLLGTYRFLGTYLSAVALWTFASAAFAPFATVFFTRHLGVSVEHLGGILSVSQLAQAIGVLFAPVLLRQFGGARGMMAAQLTAACALVILSAASRASAAAGLYWTYVACTCMSEPSLFTVLMARIPDRDQSRASAAHQMVSSVSVMVATVFAGGVISRVGYRPMFLALAACAAGAAFLFQRLAVLQ